MALGGVQTPCPSLFHLPPDVVDLISNASQRLGNAPTVSSKSVDDCCHRHPIESSASDSRARISGSTRGTRTAGAAVCILVVLRHGRNEGCYPRVSVGTLLAVLLVLVERHAVERHFETRIKSTFTTRFRWNNQPRNRWIASAVRSCLLVGNAGISSRISLIYRSFPSAIPAFVKDITRTPSHHTSN